MFLASRSTTFLTTTTRENARIMRYERKEVEFSKNSKGFFLFFLKNRELKQSHGKGLKIKGLACWGGAHMPRVTTSSDWFNFVLLDSDAGKFYIILKCFRDTDTTAKSVSSNSSSKNSDTAIYANSGKLKFLKISDLNSSSS